MTRSRIDASGGTVAGTERAELAHGVDDAGVLVDRAVLLEGGRVSYDGPLAALVAGHTGHPHHAHPTEDDAVRSGLLDEPRLR